MTVTVAVFTPFAFEGEAAETPFGPCGPVRVEALADQQVIWIGRGGDPRARVVAAKERRAVNAIGLGEGIALKPGLTLGEWAAPEDVIDQTRGTPTTFFTSSGLGYLSQSPPFCPETRAAVAGAAQQGAGIVVAAPERAITPAEVKAWGLLGGALAMPGLGPEWYLCRELEIGYAPLCRVCWVGSSRGGPGGRPQEQRMTAEAVRPLIERILPALPETHSWMESNAGARREFGKDWQAWLR